MSRVSWPQWPRLADHLQQLHVQAEEEPHGLGRHCGCSDGEAVLLRQIQAERIVNLSRAVCQCVMSGDRNVNNPTLLKINFLATVYPILE